MRLHIQQLDWPDEDRPHKYSEFETVKDKTFPKGDRILVDNRHFQNCKFENCNFVHSGGPFAFHECEVLGSVTFSPTGPAHRAMRLHEALKEAYGKGLPL